MMQPYEPPVWVPQILFLNTPDTDISDLDSQTSLTVLRLGNFTLSTLDNVEQVSVTLFNIIDQYFETCPISDKKHEQHLLPFRSHFMRDWRTQ